MKCTFLSSRPQVTHDSDFSPWWQTGSSPCSICRRQGQSLCWLLVSTVLDTLMTANRQKRQLICIRKKRRDGALQRPQAYSWEIQDFRNSEKASYTDELQKPVAFLYTNHKCSKINSESDRPITLTAALV